MKHLIDIQSLSLEAIHAILDQAQAFASGGKLPQVLAGQLLINLFYEPSTRTRVSFEIAAKRLGAEVVNVSASGSSVEKGETLLDTFLTLQAMQPQGFVIRHPDNDAARMLAQHEENTTPVINGGSGTRYHPSQALLDGFTLGQALGGIEGKKILIAGDLKRSRVAFSSIDLFSRLGAGELRLAGPESMLPERLPEAADARIFPDLESALEGVDAVMMLRIQKERMQDLEFPGVEDYHWHWGLTRERFAGAPSHCVVLHPGPMNRGVEIDSTVADSPRSLIQQQVANGVWVRMAILAQLLAADSI